jgi:hypothetical protein
VSGWESLAAPEPGPAHARGRAEAWTVAAGSQAKGAHGCGAIGRRCGPRLQAVSGDRAARCRALPSSVEVWSSLALIGKRDSGQQGGWTCVWRRTRLALGRLRPRDLAPFRPLASARALLTGTAARGGAPSQLAIAGLACKSLLTLRIAPRVCWDGR